MPAIHIVHWGDIRNEYPEVPRILKQIKKRLGYVPTCRVVLLQDPAAYPVLDAVRHSFEDKNCQILYLSCHGSLDGLHYSSESEDSLSYSMLFQELTQAVRHPEVASIIFGNCHIMEIEPAVELGMPNWIFEVGGFTGKPSPNDVADLMAGVVTDLGRLGNKAHNEMVEAVKDIPRTEIDARFKAMEAAAKGAVERHNPQPGEVTQNPNYVLAERTEVNGEWLRKGDQHFKTHPQGAATKSVKKRAPYTWTSSVMCQSCKQLHTFGSHGMGPWHLRYRCPGTQVLCEFEGAAWANISPFPTDQLVDFVALV